MELIDFNTCPENLTRVYGGRAGNKYGIVYEQENWILKFAGQTKDMKGNIEISYTTSPLSEFLGSHIYELLGIPVHETKLGYASSPSSGRERLVVACKDFLTDYQTIMEFHDIKNTQFYNNIEEGGSGKGTNLNEVLETIEKNPRFEGFREKVSERFWDMFVVDFFIENTDRNNGNWGLVREGNQIMGLTPVYDNGNAFSNKKGETQFIKRLNISEKAFLGDAYKNYISIYETDEGESIHAYELIQSMQYPDCNAAVKRFVERLDFSKIKALFDSVPAFDQKLPVMSEAQREYYLKTMELKLSEVLLPTYKKVAQNKFEERLEEAKKAPKAQSEQPEKNKGRSL